MEEDEISSTDTEQPAEMGHVYSASSDTHLQTYLLSGICLYTLRGNGLFGWDVHSGKYSVCIYTLPGQKKLAPAFN